jgi:hypothetical protein
MNWVGRGLAGIGAVWQIHLFEGPSTFKPIFEEITSVESYCRSVVRELWSTSHPMTQATCLWRLGPSR